MEDSSETPVYKLTIQREDGKGGEPKYTLVPENFNMEAVGGSTAAKTQSASGMSYVKCAVPNCNNYFDGQRSEFMGISYFPFPNDPELRQEWINAIDLPPHEITDQTKVCSDHFSCKDFVSVYIAVDEPSEPKKSKKQENVELKPGVTPSVKLGHAQRMAEFAKVTWEKNLKTYSDKGKRGGRSDEFAGLHNPIMDTANELRSSASNDAMEEVDNDSAVPVITSVGTIRQVASGTLNAIGGQAQIEIDRERGAMLGGLVDVVEVDDDDVLEEVSTKAGMGKSEEGLINVPATVKLPPRRTMTGDSSEIPLTVPGCSPSGTEGVMTPPDDPASDAVGCSEEPIRTRRTRRKRRTREEMLKQDEEDEWRPSIWSTKTLVKEGFPAEGKRRGQKNMQASKTLESSIYAGYEDSDEGFVIDEPANNKYVSTTRNRRKPGPASRTGVQGALPTSDGDRLGGDAPPSRSGDKDIEDVLADKSLLIDWAFFKSLIPDLGRMSCEKRNELKTFVLDTLNASIYEGKPIVPLVKDPVT